MPIPTNGQKAIWIGSDYSEEGKWNFLTKGMKGVVITQNYDVQFSHVFYPIAHKGYCISCNEIDFELINKKN
jgi:hypothetical protein